MCGAVVEGDPGRMTAECVFCTAILVDVEHEGSAPQRVLPFAVDMDRAAERLRRHLRRKTFAPNRLKHASRAESLHAVLVPFFAFGGIARTSVSCKAGITYTTGHGDSRRTHTEWFPFETRHVHHWQDNLVSASTGVAEKWANRLEPYDLGKALPYDPRLLAGVDTEHPSVELETAKEIASKELYWKVKNRISKEACCGMSTRELEIDTKLTEETVESLLLPVWVASYRGVAGPVSLMVNGQTGRVVGDIPTSWWKVGLTVFGVLAALTFVVGSATVLGMIFMIAVAVLDAFVDSL